MDTSTIGEVSIYCVIPQGKTVETCPSELLIVYQLCKENRFPCEWMNANEVINFKPTKKHVFVVDPFSGDAFKYLEDIMLGRNTDGYKCVDCRVVGPRCLITCINKGEPVPSLPYPIYTAAMFNVVITSTGFNKTEKAELQKKMELMGGVYSNPLHQGVTHLVAAKTYSQKYKIANSGNIPIMGIEWINKAWEKSCKETVHATDPEFKDLICPAFRGLIICVSQLSRDDKERIRKTIVSNGGEYSSQLVNGKTDIVVIPIGEGQKYEFARQWGIPCVTPDWVFDSAQQLCALDITEYSVKGKRHASTPTNSPEAPVQLNITSVSTIVPSHNETIMNAISKIEETAISEDFEDPRNDPVLNDEDFLIKVRRSRHYFLQNSKVYVHGFNQSEFELLQRVVQHGGGTWCKKLEGCTHAIVKNRQLLDSLDKVSSKPLTVSTEWLNACVNEKKCVNAAPYCYKKRSDSVQMPPPNIPPPVDQDVTSIEGDLYKQYMDDSSTVLSSQGTQNTQTIMRGIKCCICLEEGEEKQEVVNYLTGIGATVTDEEDVRDDSCDYAVVPIKGLPRYPKVEYIVNSFWVAHCIEEEQVMPVQYFHRPFPKTINPICLDGLVIVISTYADFERRYLSELVESMGAVSQDVLSRKTAKEKGLLTSTHLLCPNTSGNKYAAATKWKLRIVTRDWLLHCAIKGERLDEAPYNPLHPNFPDIPFPDPAVEEKIEEETIQDEEQMVPDGTLKQANGPETPRTAISRSLGVDIKSMKTPDTPYGFYNPEKRTSPSSTMRKVMKVLLDRMPDEPQPKPPPVGPVHTPPEVYLNILHENRRKILHNNPTLERIKSRKSVDKKRSHEDQEGENGDTPGKKMRRSSGEQDNAPDPDSCSDILKGVVLFVCNKLKHMKGDLCSAAASVGATYHWDYSNKVTHFVFQGKPGNNKQYKTAVEDNKIIVHPCWVWNCRDQKERLPEDRFPPCYDPTRSPLSLSQNTPRRTERGSAKRRLTSDSKLADKSAEETEELKQAEVSKKLEALMEVAKKGRSSSLTRKASSEPRSSSLLLSPSKFPKASDFESQGMVGDVKWDDPVARKEREKVAKRLDRETQYMGEEEDEDKDEVIMKAAEEAQVSVHAPDDDSSPPYFMFTKVENEGRWSDLLQSLGGKVHLGTDCNLQTTHLIAERLSRNEKMLSTIASGKWVLRTSYLQAAKDTNKLPSEGDHEFQESDCENDGQRKLVIASKMWRDRINNGQLKGPFEGIKAVLYGPVERTGPYQRLIESGAGTVLQESQLNDATHAFIESKHVNVTSVVPKLKSMGISCLLPQYLQARIIDHPPPSEEAFWLPEYKSLFQ